tara:strand:+ start:1245 stop:1931 length:687 start_codon:yes stop_codon:yes gene_type:complete
MNIFKLAFVALACLISVGCSQVKVSDYEGKEDLRAYISTRLALAVMTTANVPDEEEVEQCDGSGWVTHGDGHRTPCPGCPACNKEDTDDTKPDGEMCDCGCEKKDCQCEASGCLPKEKAIVESEPEYYLYHFGAEWCGPCQKLKKEVWQAESMKSFLKDKKVKLFMFDADKQDHREFFKFYKISSYPTIILLDKDKLSDIMLRTIGFKDKESVKQLLDKKIPVSVLEK